MSTSTAAEVIPPEILEIIFGYLNKSKDFASCRSVNHTWNRVASQYFSRIHRPIKLTNDKSLTEFLGFMPNTTIFPFTKFQIQLENLSLPYLELFNENYKFMVGEYFLNLRSTRKESRTHHLTEIGRLLAGATNLHSLHISLKCPFTDAQVIPLVSLLPPIFPNLKSLELCSEIAAVRPDEGRYRILNELRERSPNLTEIIHAPWKSTAINRISPCLSLFKDIPKIVLKNVSISTHVREDITSLNQVQYKLTDLRLRVSSDIEKLAEIDFIPGVFQSKIFQWFQLHSDTLISLSILSEGATGILLPELSALEHLDIGLSSYDEFETDEPPFVPFTYKQFPKLKSVCLNFYCDGWKLFSSDVFDTVDTLTIQGYQDVYVKIAWHVIFPNVKNLNLITIKIHQLKFFITNMTKVVNLNITLCAFHLPEVDEELGRILSGNCKTEEIGRPPSLARFKNLEVFRIRGCGSSSVKAIVDVSRKGSFSGLKLLKINAICPEGHDISKKDRRVLENAHRKVVILNTRCLASSSSVNNDMESK